MSETVHVTSVEPKGNGPLGRSFVVRIEAQLSVATGEPKEAIVTEHEDGVVPAFIAGGQLEIIGAWLSVTVTVCKHVDVFPAASVAVQVTVVTPLGYEFDA